MWEGVGTIGVSPLEVPGLSSLGSFGLLDLFTPFPPNENPACVLPRLPRLPILATLPPLLTCGVVGFFAPPMAQEV